MPIQLSCPSCGGALKVADNLAGRKVKCPKCATVLSVPEGDAETAVSAAAPPPSPRRAPAPRDNDDRGDYADEPRRRRDRDYDDAPPPKREGGAGNGLAIAGMVLGIVGFLVVFIPCFGWILGIVMGIVGATLSGIGLGTASKSGGGKGMAIAGLVLSILAIIWVPLYIFIVVGMFLNAANDVVQQAQKGAIIQQQILQNQGNFNPGELTPVTGNLTLNNGQATLKNTLNVNDSRDRVRFGSVCKVFTISMTAGKTYEIDLTRDNPKEVLDPFVRLEDSAGKELAHDDDGGGFPNAKLIFNCNQTGSYRIVATTFGGGVGNFTLKVQER